MATFSKYKDPKTGLNKWQWIGCIGVDPITGKQKNSRKKGFATKQDAVKDFENRRHILLNDTEQDSQEDLTLRELVSRYIVFKQPRIKSSTMYHQKTVLRTLGEKKLLDYDLKLDKISLEYAQKVFDNMVKVYGNPMPKYRIINTVLNYGVKMGYMKQNHFKNVDLFGVTRSTNIEKREYFEKYELQAFMKELKKEASFVIYVLFVLLARTGMRHGEARALTWEDIDLENGTIVIKKTVTSDDKGKIKIGDTPKTESSNRVICIDKSMQKLLNQLKRKSRNDDELLGIPFKKNELVFLSSKRNIVMTSVLMRIMKKVCTNIDLPYIKPHGLRKTYVAMMIEAGEQPINIAHIIGHTDLSMIMKVYDTMTEKRKEQASERFEAYMGEF